MRILVLLLLICLYGCKGIDVHRHSLSDIITNSERIISISEDEDVIRLSNDNINIAKEAIKIDIKKDKEIAKAKSNKHLQVLLDYLTIASILTISLGVLLMFISSVKKGAIVALLAISNISAITIYQQYIILFLIFGLMIFLFCIGYFIYDFLKSKKANKEIVSHIETIKDDYISTKLKNNDNTSNSTRQIVNEITSKNPKANGAKG